MLSRGFSRGSTPARRRGGRNRSWLAAVILFAGGTALYFLLPEAGPRMQAVTLSDGEIRAALASFAVKVPHAAEGDRAKAQAVLGRKLFNDPSLSANGLVSCATCHDAQKGFADGLPVAVGVGHATKNSPTVLNSYMNTWFYWDGRADSLAAQALKPIEDPREQAFTRVGVARALLGRYRDDYIKAFGEPPSELKGITLPEKGLPAPIPPRLAVEVSAYALATLGSFDILSEILSAAQSARTAPAMELSNRAFEGPPPDPEAVKMYRALSPGVRSAVDQMFANAGRALAAFESGLVAVESPFDRFAARTVALPAEQPIDAAFDTGFAQQELQGLKLFVGPGRCALCHSGPNFTDQQFHNSGLAQRGPGIDVGRAAGVLRVAIDPFNCAGGLIPADPDKESCKELPFLDAGNLELVGAFKTPGLRNVAQTAPYMHDGRFATLADVISHYDEQDDKPATGHREESLRPLDLTDDDKEALEAFLRALTSPVRDLSSESTVSSSR